MKVAVFQDNLKVGGIQRSCVEFVSLLQEAGVDIDLYLFSQDNFYQIPDVNIVYLKPLFFGSRGIPFEVLRKMVRLHVLDTRYDLAVDYDGFSISTALGALQVSAKRRVIWNHSDMIKRLRYNKKYRWLYRFHKSKFQHFDEIVSVSKGAKTSYQRLFGGDLKHYVIGNYLDIKRIRELANENGLDVDIDSNRINVLSIGRLTFEKNVVDLVRQFKKALEKNPQLRLYLMGDGNLRKRLENLIDDFDLEEDVILLGNQINPYKYLKQMDAYVQNSLYEGQGISIIEAQIFNLNIIIPKHLEPYTYGVKGVDSVEQALVSLVKVIPIHWNIEAYQYDVISSVNQLVFHDTTESVEW